MNLNKIVDNINKTIKESLIDYPKDSLSSSVWDKKGNIYTIKPQVKKHILNILSKYSDDNLIEIAKEIRIVGSICSNQYNKDADVDVHIIPKNIDDFDEIDVKDIISWFNDNRDVIEGYIGEHPIEVSLQLQPAQDFLSYGVYNLMSGEWAKGPQEISLDYDPYEDFSDIVKDVGDYVENADVLLGKLKRHVIDYTTIRKALQDIPSENKEKLLRQLVTKLKDIESNIEELYGEKKEWTDLRKRMSTPETPEQAKEDVELVKKWKNTDATFKFINRYKYFQIINDLYKMIEDDDKITNDEIDIIKTIMRR